MSPSHVILTLNGVMVFSSLLALRLPTNDRLMGFSLVRVLIGVPLLAAQYGYLFLDLHREAVHSVLLSESVFALTWAFAAQRLHAATAGDGRESRWLTALEFLAGLALLYGAWWTPAAESLVGDGDDFQLMAPYGFAYFVALGILLGAVFVAYRLEALWRGALPTLRWEYRFLVVGSFLLCCVFIWAGSFRLMVLHLVGQHFLLMALLLFPCWVMMLYGVGRYRLLSRKMFISREVVYVSIAPMLFGVYLLGLGAIGLVIRHLGWPFQSALLWFLAALGFGVLLLYLSSGRMRRRVLYFITTHFYVNKHNYRKEWLALSSALHGAFSEEDIVDALARILSDAVYSSQVRIWIREVDGQYRLRHHEGSLTELGNTLDLDEGDPLLDYLQVSGYFTLDDEIRGREWEAVAGRWREPLREMKLVLLAPLSSGQRIMGIIGLGSEYTGGKYWQDDFDLLQAVGSQTATAILAARRAEELASLRQRETWDALSAFVLHDIKNAATMLSLVRQNAGEHLQDPEFQQDMLEAIDNALKRMGKVQNHLSTPTAVSGPKWEELELCAFLETFTQSVSRRLTGLRIEIRCTDPVILSTDPEVLWTILENLVINSYEAGGEGTEVSITVNQGGQGLLCIEVADNGPGIPLELLPDGIFEPFRTTKARGSGIGLWQVRKLLERIAGVISVSSGVEGGAVITLSLPHVSGDAGSAEAT